jgi:hypothetical protein
MEEDEEPTHDHTSYQEAEESLGNNCIPQSYTRPTRTTINPVILSFDLNSQDRQWTKVHKAYKSAAIQPLKEEPNPQDGNDQIMYFPPVQGAIEMMSTMNASK